MEKIITKKPNLLVGVDVSGQTVKPPYLKLCRGAWLAQSEEHDLGVVSSSPTMGVEIT